MRIDILTLFPGMFRGIFAESIIKRASQRRLVKIRAVNLRDFSQDKHHKVDDRPYGGGPGMVLRCEPIFDAVTALSKGKQRKPRVILLCPQGKPYTQQMAQALARAHHLILICGHYEGVDERVRQRLATDEISIGDYVLTCGEIPAMVLVDSIVRLIPGALGDRDSVRSESFTMPLLEYPQYTRPAVYRVMKVPPVLLSGDHSTIEVWRRRQALARTRARRPDLLGSGPNMANTYGRGLTPRGRTHG